MNLDDLDGRLFASTTEAAAILDGLDPRTIRRAIASGEVPARRVGTKLLIPTSWLRQQVSSGAPAESSDPPIDLDQLADAVADRVAARLARAFGALAPDSNGAGPAPPGPAATADTAPHPRHRDGARRAHRTSAA